MMKKYVLVIFLGLLAPKGYSQVYRDKKAPVEKRIASLLSAMTLEEKLDYIGGINSMYIRGIERLNLPGIKMSDGPVGTRNDGRSTAYPAGILSAATWDNDLEKQMGMQIGRDSRARGIHILLAPGVNIARAPMCGRNFEYFGEDPYLSSRMAVGYIQGVQSQGVAATVKHFAANNQEWDRNNVSSDVDERTLQEIYFPAFKAAVQEAKVAAVMTSYNLVNGVHASESNHLINDVLKKSWDFNGFVMSDWSSVYNGVNAANAGLDLEMPSGRFMSKANLLSAIKNGQVKQAVIDDKIQRILGVLFRYGFYDRTQLDNTIRKDNPEGAKVALNLARGGIVLLKNQDKILPLSVSKIKNIAVIGPNGNTFMTGGGSSYTFPFHSVTTLQGIRNFAPHINTTYVAALPMQPDLVEKSVFYTERGSGKRGVKITYFNNKDLHGEPQGNLMDSVIRINNGWHAPGENKGFPYDHCSIRWTGVVRPLKNGRYRFTIRTMDGVRFWFNDEPKIDVWKNQGVRTNEVVMDLKAGEEYPIRLETNSDMHSVEASLSWREDKIDFTEACQAAAAADVVILTLGFNESNERENTDRTFELPPYQDSLIKAISKINRKTVVVLNSGGSVSLAGWLPDVKGLLFAWYPGQEGGTALAEILFGKVDPSGKLPVSIEKNWADNPTFNSYYDKDNHKRVTYTEGLFVGYRYYDSKNIKPLFPFGFGLSYTNFNYSGIVVKALPDNRVVVSAKIKNTGKMGGAEIVQLYIKELKPPVIRPDKELKAFKKIFLRPGEARKISFVLKQDAFEYFDDKLNQWTFKHGIYQVLVGRSSADIQLFKNISY